jgi:Mrp family chromosome partitioning ATPase
MAGERSLEEVIHHDLETGLHFLPVKIQTTNPTDLLESEKMRQLVEVCRANYDYIFIDTAPTASVTDTKVASQLADKLVFVVHWGKTIESAARDSLQSLRDAGVEPAGVVLTLIDLRKHAKYGYGDIGPVLQPQPALLRELSGSDRIGGTGRSAGTPAGPCSSCPCRLVVDGCPCRRTRHSAARSAPAVAGAGRARAPGPRGRRRGLLVAYRPCE